MPVAFYHFELTDLSFFHLLSPSPSLHFTFYLNILPLRCPFSRFINPPPSPFPPSSLPQPLGPTDLSMKSVPSANISNSTSSASTNNSLGGRGSGGGGGGGASTQLSQPEITAVRQLIAGYRESAAFLLRSADELENLILQQN